MDKTSVGSETLGADRFSSGPGLADATDHAGRPRCLQTARLISRAFPGNLYRGSGKNLSQLSAVRPLIRPTQDISRASRYRRRACRDTTSPHTRLSRESAKTTPTSLNLFESSQTPEKNASGVPGRLCVSTIDTSSQQLTPDCSSRQDNEVGRGGNNGGPLIAARTYENIITRFDPSFGPSPLGEHPRPYRDILASSYYTTTSLLRVNKLRVAGRLF
jgi:hypothetical protein